MQVLIDSIAVFFIIVTISETVMNAYRFNFGQDPTDEILVQNHIS